jgi:hypothetical protein
MERKITLKLSIKAAAALSSRIMDIKGVKLVQFYNEPLDLEMVEFVIHYVEGFKVDPWFHGVQIGILAMEAVNAYKFGIKLDIWDSKGG